MIAIESCRASASINTGRVSGENVISRFRPELIGPGKITS